MGAGRDSAGAFLQENMGWDSQAVVKMVVASILPYCVWVPTKRMKIMQDVFKQGQAGDRWARPAGNGRGDVFPPHGCANAKSATTDWVAQAGLAQIHYERARISKFPVGEAHGRRINKSNNRRSCNGASLHCLKNRQWVGRTKPFIFGNRRRSRATSGEWQTEAECHLGGVF
jgi:hypothetical protein